MGDRERIQNEVNSYLQGFFKGDCSNAFWTGFFVGVFLCSVVVGLIVGGAVG